MPTITKGDKVLVTGANGYIAMWLVRQLLEKGYAVRGTVRTEQKGDYVKKYLEELGLAKMFELAIVADIMKVQKIGLPRTLRLTLRFRSLELSTRRSKEWMLLLIHLLLFMITQSQSKVRLSETPQCLLFTHLLRILRTRSRWYDRNLGKRVQTRVRSLKSCH